MGHCASVRCVAAPVLALNTTDALYNPCVALCRYPYGGNLAERAVRGDGCQNRSDAPWGRQVKSSFQLKALYAFARLQVKFEIARWPLRNRQNIEVVLPAAMPACDKSPRHWIVRVRMDE